MPEIFRTRDVIVFAQGVTYTIAADNVMRQAGWPGGQGLAWKDSVLDEFLVTFTDGFRGAGFALWGSDEDSDKWTAMTGQQVSYGFVVLGSGSWILSTRTFEKFTYASRVSGPLVPLVYTPGDKLLWSLRGLWTKEDEWTEVGDTRAPNTNYVGQIVQPMNSAGFITLQTTL